MSQENSQDLLGLNLGLYISTSRLHVDLDYNFVVTCPHLDLGLVLSVLGLLCQSFLYISTSLDPGLTIVP